MVKPVTTDPIEISCNWFYTLISADVTFDVLNQSAILNKPNILLIIAKNKSRLCTEEIS